MQQLKTLHSDYWRYFLDTIIHLLRNNIITFNVRTGFFQVSCRLGRLGHFGHFGRLRRLGRLVILGRANDNPTFGCRNTANESRLGADETGLGADETVKPD